MMTGLWIVAAARFVGSVALTFSFSFLLVVVAALDRVTREAFTALRSTAWTSSKCINKQLDDSKD